jgi:chromosome segregation ATPase
MNIFDNLTSHKDSASGSSVEHVNGFNTNDNSNKSNGDVNMNKIDVMDKKSFKKLSKTGGYKAYNEVCELANKLKMELDEVWNLFEQAEYNFKEAEKLAKKAKADAEKAKADAKKAKADAKKAEVRAKKAEEDAKKGQITCEEGKDRLEPLYAKVDELNKTAEAYDKMANKFSNEAKGTLNYQKIHGKEIPYAQARVSELENKLRTGEGNKDTILAELKIARADLKHKEKMYAFAENERRISITASKRALKEGNAVRNGELSEAENDLRTINQILAKY